MDPSAKNKSRLRTRTAFLAGAAVAAAAFLAYLRTLAPTVLGFEPPVIFDSPMLQTEVATLGIGHPTGYPTYMMLTHLFTYLPFGDAAYRVNLSSALYAALAVALIYAIGFVLSRRVVAAAAGALAFALSELFWSQAVVAEVYTLNALFVSLVVLVFLWWRESRRDRWLLVAAFLCGLSLTHHITSGLLAPAGLLFMFLVERGKLRDVGLLLKGAGLFVLGLLPYAYLPIRASMDYLPDGWVWGQPLIREYPPNTPYGFYNLVSGGLWKERMWAFGVEELPGRLALYMHYLYGEAGQFGVALLLVAWGGFLYLAFRDRAAAALLGFLFIGWLFHALEYDIEDIYYYFIPTYLVLAVLMTVGIDGLLTAADSLAGGAPPWARAAILALISVAALVLPLLGAGETYREVDRSGDYHGREIVEAVAEKADPGATVLHHRSPLDYMILAEGRRKDLSLIPYLEDPEPPAVERAGDALEDGPVYVLFPGRETTPYYPGVEDSRKLYGEAGLDLVEVDGEALLYEVVPRDGSA